MHIHNPYIYTHTFISIQLQRTTHDQMIIDSYTAWDVTVTTFHGVGGLYIAFNFIGAIWFMGF